MKIALIMPPLTTGKMDSNSLFRFIHDCARGRPYWNPFLYRFTRKISCIDFDFYPNSLVQIGTVLKDSHEVKIFNFLEKNYFKSVINFAPRIIGISCSGGGNLVWVDKMIREFKKRLSVKIILGGPHVSLAPEETLNTTVADYVCNGESDFVIAKVVDYIEGKAKKLPNEGVCYRKDGRVIVNPPSIVEDLSRLPVPDHSLMDLRKYRSIGVEFSRGCPYDCYFCYLSGYKKKIYWRHRPISSMLKELKQLRNLINMENKRIYFLDVNFSGNNERLKRLLKEIIDYKIKISFWAGLDINIEHETLKLMKEAGCSFLYTGIETGAASKMNNIHKVKSIKKIEAFIERVQKIGISSSFNIIFLLPEETKEDLEDTMKLCKRISKIRFNSQRRLMNLSFYPHIFRPVPGTKLSQKFYEKNLKMPRSFLEWGELYSDIANGRFKKVNFSKNLEKKDIILAMIRIIFLNIKQILNPRVFKYLYKNKMVKFNDVKTIINR